MDEDATDGYILQVGEGAATRFSDDAREAAYQLWAFAYRGNCEKVSAALLKHDPPIKVEARSVRRWAADGQWAIRKADDWRKIAPDLARQTVIEARYGLLEAAVMARDTVTNETMLTVETVSPSGSVTKRQVPQVSRKERIIAGALLQKIEESLRTIPDGDQQQQPTRDLRSLSDAELLALERSGR